MKRNNAKYLENFFGLKNKKIIITGCSGQLGMSLVNAFLNCGCTVIGLDLKKSRKKLGKNFFYYQLDVSDHEENNLVFEKIFKNHKEVDCLINNVGVAVFQPFTKRSENELDFVTNVNLKSYIYSIKNFYKKSKKSKTKSIINVSSIYSVISPDPRIYGKNDRKSSEIYGATKAGVNQMTRYFAVHLSDKNIRVNSIAPGITDTEMLKKNTPENLVKKVQESTSLNRIARPEEIANVILFLSSDLSSYITGQVIRADGGM